jgi:hypothetical protein
VILDGGYPVCIVIARGEAPKQSTRSCTPLWIASPDFAGLATTNACVRGVKRGALVRRHAVVLAAAIGLAWQGGAMAADRSAQAWANYQALVAGTRQLGDLTPQEKADIAALDRYLREHRDNRTPSQRCVDDEMRRAGGSVTRLERRIIDMKCREPGE